MTPEPPEPHPCEVCQRPERIDTVELTLSCGRGTVWACGECGYQLLKDGDLGDEDDEDFEYA